jgi:hypothetical protein
LTSAFELACQDTGLAVGLDESAAEQSLHTIALRIRWLDGAIRDLVTRHQEELLAQAGHTAHLKVSVKGIAERTERLLKAMQRIRRDLLVPFGELKVHTRQLERSQAAGDLLRRVLRAQFTIRKLKAMLVPPAVKTGVWKSRAAVLVLQFC